MTTRALKRDLAALDKDMSPRAQALEATRAARARDENRDDRPPQRSWGQSTMILGLHRVGGSM